MSYATDRIYYQSYTTDYNTVKYDSLILQTLLTGEISNCVTNNENGFLIQNIYAWKCAPYRINYKDKILSLDIKTINNYNSNFKKDSSITSMFNCYLNNQDLQSNKYINISNVLDSINNRFATSENGNYIQTIFTLNQKSTNSGDTVQFTVKCQLVNGLTLYDTTKKMIIVF